LQNNLTSEFKAGCASLSVIYGRKLQVVQTQNEKKEGISKKICAQEYSNMVMA